MDSIDTDSDEIAREQDRNRTNHERIPVQDLFHIDENVYALMDDRETIYIVSHGRAAMGSFPAVLEQTAAPSEEDERPAEGKIRTTGEKARYNIDGARIAGILQTIRTKLTAAGKEIGPVKIEACMSAMRRTTKGKRLGSIPRFAEPSLIDDIKKNLPRRFPAVLRGNTGFATGTEFSPGGVQVTDEKHTQLGLLANMLELLSSTDLLNDPSGENRQALFLDARHLVAAYREDFTFFDRYLNVAAPSLHIHSYNAICVFLDSDGRRGNPQILDIIITSLSNYAKMDTSAYEH